jgi:microcystin-dependent protein
MTSPYIGEVRMFGGSFAPVNWALCNGQSLAISQYSALYTLIGTTYGGDGTQSFNLPNLQGRLCVGIGQGPGLSPYVIGQSGGVETVTLTSQTTPGNSHPLMATTTGASLTNPSANLTGAAPSGGYMYTINTSSPAPTFGNLNSQACSTQGGNQPHSNLMSSQCVTFIIALYGIFPSQT